MNSVIQDNTPEIVTDDLKQKKYSRQERRHGSFVIKNNVNGKYVKLDIDIKANKTKSTDVDIEQATYFKHKSLTQAMGFILMNAPNMDIRHELAYRTKDGIETK